MRFTLLLTVALVANYLSQAAAVCDGNPHNWGRVRRCDQFDPSCPQLFKDCGACEGIGGVAFSDDDADMIVPPCKVIGSAEEMTAQGVVPVKALLPETFVNEGFFEVQIFKRRDPFCFAQIPSMVSNGTHCFKPQQGSFNYDATQGALRIDYTESRTTIPNVNMTEYFYHTSDGKVHPHITNFGAVPTSVICPCIDLGVGPVSPNWADGALYVGRVQFTVEFLNQPEGFTVDHWVKGPHHAFVDIQSKQIIRMWQPFNGLEIFDPTKWNLGEKSLPKDAFVLPKACEIEAHFCINGKSPAAVTKMASKAMSFADVMAGVLTE